MVKKCYKDVNRDCNEECAAYVSSLRHGTPCLELSVNVELIDRLKEQVLSNNLNSASNKMLADTIAPLGEGLKLMMSS